MYTRKFPVDLLFPEEGLRYSEAMAALESVSSVGRHLPEARPVRPRQRFLGPCEYASCSSFGTIGLSICMSMISIGTGIEDKTYVLATSDIPQGILENLVIGLILPRICCCPFAVTLAVCLFNDKTFIHHVVIRANLVVK